MKTIALITARGGSKGLSGKNIKPLLGKPLIQYTLEAALACPLIDAVYVSTDTPEIASLSAARGALPMPLRPAELATDTASTGEVIQHFLGWYRDEVGPWPDVFVLLQPTSPLRTANHLQEALSLYQISPKPCSVIAVCQTKPLGWQGSMDEGGRLQRHEVVEVSKNRQALPINYRINGAIYCTSPQRAYEGALAADPVYGYVMAEEVSVDIDTLLDFQLAELLLKAAVPNIHRAAFSEVVV